jgi:hypothetical protein
MSWNGSIVHSEYSEDEKYMDEVFQYFLSFAPEFRHKDRINTKHGWESQAFENQKDMTDWYMRSTDDSFVEDFLEFTTNSLVTKHPLVQKWWLSDTQLNQIFDDIGSSVYDEYNKNGFNNFDVIINKNPLL